MESSIFFLLCFIGLSCENRQKIFKGTDCTPHSQPWQVALFEGTQLRCGGVLIDRRWILTAAHCSASRYWLSLGEHSLSQLDWTEQIRHSGLSVTHPGYQAALQNHDNDLRLLQTSCQTDSNALTSLSSLMPPAGQRSPGESRTTWCVLAASRGRMPARVTLGVPWYAEESFRVWCPGEPWSLVGKKASQGSTPTSANTWTGSGWS
nr:kallikrein-12-like isoform X5 [Kogia breviceps]